MDKERQDKHINTSIHLPNLKDCKIQYSSNNITWKKLHKSSLGVEILVYANGMKELDTGVDLII